MNTSTKHIFYYAPRVLGILTILFISSFAMDVFVAGEPLLAMLFALFIHLIPSFALILLLVITWRFEQIGGVLFILISTVPFLLLSNEWWVNTLLAVPFLMVGILFIAHARWSSAHSLDDYEQN